MKGTKAGKDDKSQAGGPAAGHGETRPHPGAPQADVLALQHAAGNQAVSRLLQPNGAPPPIQAKLLVGPAGDRYEREADQVAELVMRQAGTGRPATAEPPSSRRPASQAGDTLRLRPLPANGRSGGRPPVLRRQPEDEEEFDEEEFDEETDEAPAMEEAAPVSGQEGEEAGEEEQAEEEPDEEDEIIRPKGGPGAPASVPHGLESRIQGLRGQGDPLPPAQRRFFESRMGYDLSGVRLHTGAGSAETADSLRARAFTIGQDIVFGDGEYSPRSDEGQRLLAHELAHVVQQGQRPRPVIRRDKVKKPATIQQQYRRYRARGGKLSFMEWKSKYGPAVTRRHHTVPQEFTRKLPNGKYKHPAVAKRLKALKIDIHRLIIDIPELTHKGIHQGKWNRELNDWFKKNPNFTKAQLQQQINGMLDRFGVPRKYRPPRERYGRGPRQPKFYEKRRLGKKKYQRQAAAKKKAALKTKPPVKTPVKPPAPPVKTPAPPAKTAVKPVKPGVRKLPRLNLKNLRFPKIRFGGIKAGNIIIFVGVTALEFFIGSALEERAQKRMEAEIESRINALAKDVETQLESSLKAKEADLVRLLEQNPDSPVYANVKYRLTFHVIKSGIAAAETGRDVDSVELVSAEYSLQPAQANEKVQTQDITGCGAMTGQVFELEHHPIVASESFPVRDFFEAEE